jgi:hypothetical protein
MTPMHIPKPMTYAQSIALLAKLLRRSTLSRAYGPNLEELSERGVLL